VDYPPDAEGQNPTLVGLVRILIDGVETRLRTVELTPSAQPYDIHTINTDLTVSP